MSADLDASEQGRSGEVRPCASHAISNERIDSACLRRLWVKTHRWLGLVCGGLLVLVGLSGALLVVARPLDRLSHPQLFVAPPGIVDPAERRVLQQAQEYVRMNFGDAAAFTLRPPREPGQTLWVLVRSPAWSGTLYLDPVTAAEQGRRGEYEGVANLLFKFHSSLFLQDFGKGVLAWAALLYCVLFMTGIYLWWPRHGRPAFRFVTGKGLRGSLFNLHRTAGVFCGAVILLSVMTGAYLAWRPLASWITAAAGQTATKAPTIANEGAPSPRALALDAMADRAQARFPGSTIGYIQVPAEARRPIRVRLKLADDPHPNGLSSVWLHPRTGEILAVHRWDELDPGARAQSYVYPLHTGEFGGMPMELAVLIGGAALGVLGTTGLVLYVTRKSRRRPDTGAS